MDILVYVVCHSDASEAIAKEITNGVDFARIVRVGESVYFENQVFDYLHDHENEWKGKDFVGVVSYNFTNKTKKSLKDIYIEVEKNKENDVISLFNLLFFNNATRRQIAYYNTGSMQHTIHTYLVLRELFVRNGFQEQDVIDDKIKIWFCNFWLAKPEWMKRFISFYRRCIVLLENDATLKEYIFKDSYYVGSCTKETLVRITGKEHYTLHPFVFERLSGYFFSLSGAKIFQGGKWSYYVAQT